MRCAVAALLVLVAVPAAAERRTNGLSRDVACRDVRPAHQSGDLRLESGLGVGRTWLGTPDSTSRTTSDVQLSFGSYTEETLAYALRGHIQLGQASTSLTSIGVEARRDLGIDSCHKHARSFVAAGPAVAVVRGPEAIDALAAVVDLRIGVVYRTAHVALDVMPGYAFANDSIAAEADLHWLVRVGVSVGIDY